MITVDPFQSNGWTDGFLTCTTRTDKAGRRSGSRASSSSRWWVTTSSALSAFTSSAYLRKRAHACQASADRSNATQRPAAACQITGNLSIPKAMRSERLTGRGGGGSGPRARPRRPGRPRRRRRSAGRRAPRCTPRGGGRACPSAARPRRPRTAAAAAPAVGDYPRPWIYRRTASCGRAASRSKSDAACTEEDTRRPCCAYCSCMGGGGAHVKRRRQRRELYSDGTERRGSE